MPYFFLNADAKLTQITESTLNEIVINRQGSVNLYSNLSELSNQAVRILGQSEYVEVCNYYLVVEMLHTHAFW